MDGTLPCLVLILRLKPSFYENMKVLSVFAFFLLPTAVLSSDSYRCKCTCIIEGRKLINYTSTLSCQSCSRSFCLGLCRPSIEKEPSTSNTTIILDPVDMEDVYDILTSCYLVGSTRDEFVIITFLVVTSVLTIYSLLKQVRQQEGVTTAHAPSSASIRFTRVNDDQVED